jgi:hypothetical protein
MLRRNAHFVRVGGAVRILAVFAAVAASLAFSSVREPVLRAMGRALVADEPVGPADVIVVSLYSGGAGALQAADLVQSGIATRVVVFVDPPNDEDREFVRRGLPDQDASARQVRQLKGAWCERCCSNSQNRRWNRR